MNENEFTTEVKKLGVEVDETKLQLLREYYQKLKKKSRINCKFISYII